MEVKKFLLILLFIITIKCIESKKSLRTFVVSQDKPPKPKPLTDFTAYDSREKNRWYLIRTTSTDLDTIVIIDYRAKKIIANVEGEWVNNIFNVTFSIYDDTLDKWIDGVMLRKSKVFSTKYEIQWNNERLYIKPSAFRKTMKIYKETSNELYAQFRYRSIWRTWSKYKYDLQIYTTKLPDALYLMIMTVMHHTTQLHNV
ncbi:unnamed protein product [Adineta steineri]|uniref:Uncharacterized protein n=1 Tax=Adineta steineri TaxID=433720 RepID=A0A819SN60_9BILA|nr:unnamed protein product [Adineta steineri]CAF4062201.1 unnamed protein product [Adineta steineri]